MGQTIGSVIEEKNKDPIAVEQLQSYKRMVAAKLEAESAKISKQAFNDPRLPILSVVKRAEKYSLNVTSKANENIEGCLKSVVGGGYLKGLTSLLTVALDELLGNTAVGEYEKNEFHVVFASNSLLRVDYYMYKYQMNYHGLRDKVQNIFCYYIQVGVLDVMKVRPQILLYQLTRSVGDEDMEDAKEKLSKMADFTTTLYKVVTALRQSAAEPGLPDLEGDGEEENVNKKNKKGKRKTERTEEEGEAVTRKKKKVGEEDKAGE